MPNNSNNSFAYYLRPEDRTSRRWFLTRVGPKGEKELVGEMFHSFTYWEKWKYRAHMPQYQPWSAWLTREEALSGLVRDLGLGNPVRHCTIPHSELTPGWKRLFTHPDVLESEYEK